MVLLTTTSMNHLVENGTFLLNQVNENPGVTLALYYVLPRCLMAMSFVYVSNIVNQVIRKSLKNAMKMEEKAATDTIKTSCLRPLRKEHMITSRLPSFTGTLTV